MSHRIQVTIDLVSFSQGQCAKAEKMGLRWEHVCGACVFYSQVQFPSFSSWNPQTSISYILLPHGFCLGFVGREQESSSFCQHPFNSREQLVPPEQLAVSSRKVQSLFCEPRPRA